MKTKARILDRLTKRELEVAENYEKQIERLDRKHRKLEVSKDRKIAEALAIGLNVAVSRVPLRQRMVVASAFLQRAIDASIITDWTIADMRKKVLRVNVDFDIRCVLVRWDRV